MNSKYEVGMRVCKVSDKNRKGTVLEIMEQEGNYLEIKVKWDKYDTGYWCQYNDIFPDTPEAHQQMNELTKQVQAKINEATTLLEQAFKAWFEAASLQAGHEAGTDETYTDETYHLLNNEDLDLSKFEKIFEQNGWSTSSLYC